MYNMVSFRFITGFLVIAGALLSIERVNARILQCAPPELLKIIDEGISGNKEVKSMESYLAKLKEEISLAGSLDDPRVGIGILNLPVDKFRFDREPMTQKQLFVAQKIPWFGKLSIKKQLGALKAGRQEAILMAKKLEIARAIATVYYELGFNACGRKINERLVSMMRQMLRAAEAGYAAGRGLQQDVLLAQVELSKLIEEKIVLEKNRHTLEDRINELLGRKKFIPVNPPDNIIYPDVKLNVEQLSTRALQKNPWIIVKAFDVDHAGLEIDLALKDYWPDMDFKFAYCQRDENRAGSDLADFASASVVINIPIWKKARQDKKLSAGRLGRQAAINAYQNMIDRLPYKVDALCAEVSYNQKSYLLMSEAMIVQAEQWARSSLAAYKVGKIEFDTMIRARIQLLRFELKVDRYLFDIYKKLAELEELVGGSLPVKDIGIVSSPD